MLKVYLNKGKASLSVQRNVLFFIPCLIPFTGQDDLNKLVFIKCKGLHSLVGRATAALMHRPWVRIPLKSPFLWGTGGGAGSVDRVPYHLIQRSVMSVVVV